MRLIKSDLLPWYCDLVTVLVRKELAVRYKNSMLGYLWSVMNPLALALVFYVVFSIYMRMDIPNYLVVLLSAMFPWQWFSNSVGQSPFAFLSNATLVKKLAFPRYIIPLVNTLNDMVHFVLALPILLLFKLYYGLYPHWNWLIGVPLLLVISLATIFGISLIISSINLFFRDLGNLVAIAMNILFYASPVIYTLTKVPPEYYIYFKLNPVAPLLISWRSLLYDNRFDPEYLPWATGYGVMAMLLGYIVYNRLNSKFAEAL